VRADHLDTVVWDHITGLLADPQLIRTEIDKRLDSARTANPVAQQRKRLDTALAKTSNAIAGMIEAFGEQLITIDELRARMPDLRARETNLRNQIQALDNQVADREAYLKLASDLEGFLTQLHAKAELSTIGERQRVLRLLVKDVLVGPDKITIRHRIPIRERATAKLTVDADTEDDHAAHCPLRWGRDHPALRRARDRPLLHTLDHHPCLQPQSQQFEHPPIRDPPTHLSEQAFVVDLAEEIGDIELDHKLITLDEPTAQPLLGHHRRPFRPKPIRARHKVRLENRFQHELGRRLDYPVSHRGNPQRPLTALWFRDLHPTRRRRAIPTLAKVTA
jgi:site-specific DNA recombinase